MPRFRTIALAALAAAAAALVRPPAVIAGTYTVHSCHTPSGALTDTTGWTTSASPPVQGQDSGLASACNEDHPSLGMRFGVAQLPVAASRWVGWTFSAPAATEIASIAIVRTLQLAWPVQSGRYGRPYVYDVWHDDDLIDNQLEFDLPPWNGDTAGIDFPESLEHTGVAWNSISLRLSCWGLVGSLDCGPFQARVGIARASVGLTDEVAPEGAATGGTLAGAGPVRGVADLALHATDAGGGVYRVALVVDGEEVVRQVLDAAGGECADVDPANVDAHEFDAPQPCPLDADGSLQLDTRTLRDGAHTVRATVEDAGGNEAVAFDATVQTHNAPISGGAPVVGGEARVGGQLTASAGSWDGAPTAYDHRWLRCDASGGDCTPVAGASGAAYAITDADAYHRMRVEVTAENGSGAATARSAPSALVADADGRTAPPASQSGRSSSGTGGNGSGAGGGVGANPLGDLPGHVANGDGATAHARVTAAFQRADGSTTRRIRLRHGRRSTIVGRLLDAAGAGIGGARLGAAWRVAGRGWIARPGVRTGADGRFVYVLPPGPSRDVRFTYFAYSDSRAVELSNAVRADVLAPLTIRADRAHVSGRRVVRLSGRVGGRGIPRAGLLVTLQGFQRGWGWRTFRTVRTDPRGRWRTSYRFRLSSGRFGFRALLPRQGAFPYATNRSRGVFVVVS